MGRKTFTGKVELTAQEVSFLKEQAKRGISAAAVISDLKKKLEAARQDARIWKERYESLQTQTKDFLAALKKAPEAVKSFLSRILHMNKLRELTEDENCKFVLRIGSKRLIKRQMFEKYLEQAYSL